MIVKNYILMFRHIYRYRYSFFQLFILKFLLSVCNLLALYYLFLLFCKFVLLQLENSPGRVVTNLNSIANVFACNTVLKKKKKYNGTILFYAVLRSRII
jgi:hypothetical protein